MPITINWNPGLDFTISANQTTPKIGAMLNGRLVVNTSGECLENAKYFFNTIGNFFSQRYTDFRLLIRACNSIDCSRTPRSEIEQRITQITRFIAVIQNPESDRTTIRIRFQQLPPSVQELFFNLEQNINGLEDGPLTQEFLQELIHECEQVICFQRQLIAVKTLCRFCFPSSEAVSRAITTEGVTSYRSEGPVEQFSWNSWIHSFFPVHFFTQERGVTHVPSVTTTNGLNLNIPGTIPYVQNAIPNDVQNKANQINTLKARFGALPTPPAIPPVYKDIIMGDDFMAIPVFDASHPEVQNAMRRVANGAISAAADLNNRDLRHLLDKDVLEAHLQEHVYRRGAPDEYNTAKCPVCRHPTIEGGIRRQNLRVDTALQDEMLHFLRTYVDRP